MMKKQQQQSNNLFMADSSSNEFAMKMKMKRLRGNQHKSSSVDSSSSSSEDGDEATTTQPSDGPSFQPTLSLQPSDGPSLQPTLSLQPSDGPSFQPTLSLQPSDGPSFQPTLSLQPSDGPSLQPTLSLQPSDGSGWIEPCDNSTVCDPFAGTGCESGCGSFGFNRDLQHNPSLLHRLLSSLGLVPSVWDSWLPDWHKNSRALYHNPSLLHRLLSSLGLVSSAWDDDGEEPIEVVEEVAFDFNPKCDVPEQSDIPDTWHIYDELIKKNRKMASMARNVKEYAPKRGLVEDIIEQQDAEDEDSDDKDTSKDKDMDELFIPHNLIFTHEDNLLDCEVSSSEPSLHTMAHNVRDTIGAYRQVWGDDMEYTFLTDVDCRKAIYEAEPKLLAYYDRLPGMLKGDICRSAYLYLNGG